MSDHTETAESAHRPNGCCDYHRHIADGCCHCEQEPVDEQGVQWAAHVAEQRAKGRCEFSGMRVSVCVNMICDCFETPEGAAAIERAADGHVCMECQDCIHNGAKCCGCYDNACCHEVVLPPASTGGESGE